MKTSIQKLFVSILTVGLLSSNTLMANDLQPSTSVVTVLNQIKNINKLVVSGNVEVYLVQGDAESVKVYDSYYAKNALVQAENGTLRISSFQKEPLKVMVYVKNLSSIQASEQASVKSFGKLNLLSLDVMLKDRATAALQMNVADLFTSVKDSASLSLSGEAQDHTAVLGTVASLNMSQFAAVNTAVSSVPVKLAAKPSVKAETLESLSTFIAPELGK